MGKDTTGLVKVAQELSKFAFWSVGKMVATAKLVGVGKVVAVVKEVPAGKVVDVVKVVAGERWLQ